MVASLVLISFGYTGLPFWPQGKTYEAYFTDAAGISPGSDVNVSGIKVGHVESVGLAGTAAKVRFTVDRKVRVGEQSLAAIKTETVLGEKLLEITPALKALNGVVMELVHGKPMAEKLSGEILAAAENQGDAVKKKQDVQRMAEANRAFAHFAR